MKDRIFSLDLLDFPNVDKESYKDVIIDGKKKFNKLLKDSRDQSKLDKCYYCGKKCKGFCNSHTTPAFCLRNIAVNGKVYYCNTLIDIPLLNEDKGVNEAGTFRLICRECDSKIFQEYENSENYNIQPSIKMLAQIDMKNNLKNISKRLMEIEMYGLMNERIGLNSSIAHGIKEVSNIDLKEYIISYNYAKKSANKPCRGDYYIGFYKRLPYVVPVAFQGTVAIVTDLKEKIINNIYIQDPKYKIKSMMICIFPLEKSSVIMLAVDKNNRRYSDFFKQLNKINDIDEQLSVINYILFSYCEDYFISPIIQKVDLNKLNNLVGKTTQLFATSKPTIQDQIQAAIEMYNYNNKNTVPNLLSKRYAIKTEN